MHDKNGKPIKAGDKIVVAFTIVEISATDEYCNVCAATVDPFYPSDRHDKTWFNSRQVEKIEE